MREEHRRLLEAWRINDRITTFLVERIPPALWTAALPASPRRTVRSIGAHLHNTRCNWLKSLAAGAGVAVPARVDRASATPTAVATALRRSDEQILLMLQAGFDNGGDFPGVSSAFVWGAIPRNVPLFVAYAVSHEAHHRGQVLLMARELGQRLPREVVAGLWQWSSRRKEAGPEGASGA